MPQLPQVSHGDSSTRSSTVLLGAATGVGVGEGEAAGVGEGDAAGVGEGEAAGVGEGDAAGVGPGTALVTVVVPVVPHDTNARVSARMATTKTQDPESAIRQGRKASLLYKGSGRSRRAHSTSQWVNLDYGKNLRRKN